MAKYRFYIIVFVVCFTIQHVHFSYVKNKQTQAWRDLCVYVDAKRAHAAVPVAGALAFAGGPYYLAGLVLGTGAYYCWTHGGKEAYWQMIDATQNGVSVTKQWVQEQIAELNGIDTSAAPGVDFDFAPGVVSYGGTLYRVGSLYKESGLVLHPMPMWTQGYLCFGLYADPVNPTTRMYARMYNYLPAYPNITAATIGPAPGGFDPADYPDLYTGPALFSNCHAVARAHPDLIYHAPDVGTTVPPDDDDLPVYSPPPYIVATYADGSAIDNEGKLWPPLPGAVWPGIINPPILEPTNAAQIAGTGGTYVIPKNVADQLAELGIPAGATITDIGQGFIEWEKDGEKKRTIAPPATTAALPQNITNSTTKTKTITKTEPEPDPGDPSDPEWGFMAAIFDTDFDWGDNSTIDIDSHLDIVKNLPLVAVVQGSSFQISDPISILNVPLNFPGVGEYTLTFDFAQFEWLYDIMGRIIYFFALIRSLNLAFLMK